METAQDTAASSSSGQSAREGKLVVSCKTCNVTKVYVTPQGVNAFKLEHSDHEVIDNRLDLPESSRLRGPRAVAELVEENEPEVVRPEEMQSMQADFVSQESDPGTALAPLTEKDRQEPLLLSMSSYVEEGDEKRREALRVSRTLKEFRWNVQPPYLIGVMQDDNLSIETNTGVLSSKVLGRMEQIGYTFVAVSAPQGSPVAWFKKKKHRQNNNNNGGSGDLDGMASTSEAGDRGMQSEQGKRKINKKDEAWEESFLSLLTSAKDLDDGKLKQLAGMIRSAAQAEPDVSE